MSLTPEERAVIELRITELKGEMAAMKPLSLNSAGVAKWAELYTELDALELQLEGE
jgi:hypothetical protein